MVLLNVTISHCFVGCNFGVCRHITIQQHIEEGHKEILIKESGTKENFLPRIKIINIKNNPFHKLKKKQ